MKPNRLSAIIAGILSMVVPAWTVMSAEPAPPPEQRTLIKSGQGGYAIYRIPALVAAGNNTILLFLEGRKDGGLLSDFGEMHLVQLRSVDGGKTWSEPVVVWQESGKDISITGPCPVYDAQSKAVHLAFTRDCQDVFVMTSLDDGQSWGTPRNITASVSRPGWNRYWTGPGHGLQLAGESQPGRLVLPCYHLEGEADQKSMRSHMVISDDHGKTWHAGESTTLGESYAGRPTRYSHKDWLPEGCQWHGCECMVVEAKDGKLFLIVRNQAPDGKKGVAWSRDGGQSWSPLERHDVLPDIQCQSSIVRCPPVRGDAGKDWYLFTGPAPQEPNSRQRTRLTIFSSQDECQTWRAAKVMVPGGAAYSDLCVTADGHILCAYEVGKGACESIDLARFNPSWLSGSD